jgi:DNA-binding transcriptional LysR family regulator
VSVKLRPEIGRKISVAYRKGERTHPALRVFIEELVRAASGLH